MNERVVLHHQPDAARMMDLMLTCDLAVTAAGQTVHELLATGLPFVAIEVVDNQANNVKVLQSLAPFVRIVRRPEDFMFVFDLLYAWAQGETGNTNALIDGAGARRIIEFLK